MRATLWLTDSEQDLWRTYLRATSQLSDVMDRDMQRHGVSVSEYEILALLSEATDQSQRMSAIAENVVQSRSRLSHTAKRLERRGWVTRRPSPDDRRGVELCLTGGGIAAVQALAPIHVRSVRRHLFDHLDTEQRQALADIMSTLRTKILLDEQRGFPEVDNYADV